MKYKWIKNRDLDDWPSLKVLSESFKQVIGQSSSRNSTDSIYLFMEGCANTKYLSHCLNSIPKGSNIGLFLYGDVTALSVALLLVENQLLDYNVKFFVGSKSNYKLLELFYNQQQIAYVPFFLPIRQNVLWQHPVRKNKIRVVYIGRISWNKNISQTIEFIKKLSMFISVDCFDIIGPIDNTKWKKSPNAFYSNYTGEEFYQTLVKHKDDEVKLKYHGSLSKDEIFKVLKNCDLAISLSTAFEEDFGLALHECLEQGIPVVASKWGGHRDIEEVKGVKLIDLSCNYNDENFRKECDSIIEILNYDRKEIRDSYNSYHLKNKILANKLLNPRYLPFRGFSKKLKEVGQHCSEFEIDYGHIEKL